MRPHGRQITVTQLTHSVRPARQQRQTVHVQYHGTVIVYDMSMSGFSQTVRISCKIDGVHAIIGGSSLGGMLGSLAAVKRGHATIVAATHQPSNHCQVELTIVGATHANHCRAELTMIGPSWRIGWRSRTRSASPPRCTSRAAAGTRRVVSARAVPACTGSRQGAIRESSGSD